MFTKYSPQKEREINNVFFGIDMCTIDGPAHMKPISQGALGDVGRDKNQQQHFLVLNLPS